MHAVAVLPWAVRFSKMQVAIYSPADRLQPHRYKADEAYCVGTPDMQVGVTYGVRRCLHACKQRTVSSCIKACLLCRVDTRCLHATALGRALCVLAGWLAR